MSNEAIAIMLLSLLFAVIGYLLARKDSQQEREIEDLHQKHVIDSDKLNSLELFVAREYHRKSEVDNMFIMMRTALSDGFKELKEAIKELQHNRDDRSK